VIASLLFGMDRPRMRGALLVRWCALFDVGDGTARVALSRMTAQGELIAEDGSYELAGRLAARRRDQEWALAPELSPWRGGWELAIVAPGARPATERQALRDAMRRSHLGELREGVWARPDNLPTAARPEAARVVIEGQCGVWQATPPDDPVVLADQLFDPAGWARRADDLLARLDAASARLVEGESGLVAEAFVVGAAALVHVRADPLLPPALRPSTWPGAELRDHYRQYRHAFATATASWFRANRSA